MPGSLYPEEVMMLKPFSISPSYQSELSDCSFFPPTHSSLAREQSSGHQAQVRLIRCSWLTSNLL